MARPTADRRRSPRARGAAALRVGVDTGGTFTDVVARDDDGTLAVHKVPSTPDDPARAVVAGLAWASARGGERPLDVVHGTTVGLNAVLTGRLPRTALVTNAGFEDLIEIGRQARSDLYDLAPSKPVPPVPRSLRFGVGSRRGADGSVLARPTAKELSALCERLRRQRVRAVAIGLLHADRHPEDERRVARALASLAVPITCSGEVGAAGGEYERFCAAVLNAAMAPIVAAYVAHLRDAVAPGRIRLMRSSGGAMSAEEATAFPARAAFSGPAGGVLASERLARHALPGKTPVAATLDIGGTSADVCLVRPGTGRDPEFVPTLAGLPLALPCAPIHTIGCGGGSIAHVDVGGALRVGPHSAGADPGPACYGHSDVPTLTDAHVVLGHLGRDSLLGGGFPVEPERSLAAVAALGRRLGLSPMATAAGIVEVAEVAMMRAVLTICTARGVDPRAVPLIAFGGAGGLHAAGLARRLSMPSALVPEHPGAFSAVGLAHATASVEAWRPLLRPATDRAALRAAAAELTEHARGSLVRGARAAQVQVTAWVRAAGQGSPVALPFGPELERRFADEHRRLFGFVPEHRRVEVLSLQARVEAEEARREPAAPSRHRRTTARPHGQRGAMAGAKGPRFAVFTRADLRPGQVLHGPAIVEELSGTTLVPAGFRLEVRYEALALQPSGRA